MTEISVHKGIVVASRIIFPSVCVICGSRASGEPCLDLCSECVIDLPLNDPACVRCAEPLPASVPKNSTCGRCLRKPPKYQNAFCAYRYAYPIDHLLRAFKFNGRVAYGRALAELFAHRLIQRRSEPLPQLLIPVPLATARFNDRGFNQAIELGKVVATRLGTPLRSDVVERTRSTREQTGLDRAARRKNLRGAFRVTSAPRAKHVAILDDVITTGSTVDELTRVLRRVGVKRVEVWAVARTERS